MRTVGTSLASGLAGVVMVAGLALPVGLASAQMKHENNYANRQGQLATRPLYPPNRADSVRRPGFNGRLWVGESIIGGAPERYPVAWGDPGPTAYGADDRDFSCVYAKVGEVVSSLSPWEYVQGRGARSLEASRAKWLRDNGYTGGVRTFVNDLYLMRHDDDSGMMASAEDAAKPAGLPQPRATIQLPLDQPRFKARMQVDAGSKSRGAAAIVTLAKHDGVMRVSKPGETGAASERVVVLAGPSGVIRPAGEVEQAQAAAAGTGGAVASSADVK